MRMMTAKAKNKLPTIKKVEYPRIIQRLRERQRQKESGQIIKKLKYF